MRPPSPRQLRVRALALRVFSSRSDPSRTVAPPLKTCPAPSPVQADRRFIAVLRDHLQPGGFGPRCVRYLVFITTGKISRVVAPYSSPPSNRRHPVLLSPTSSCYLCPKPPFAPPSFDFAPESELRFLGPTNKSPISVRAKPRDCTGVCVGNAARVFMSGRCARHLVRAPPAIAPGRRTHGDSERRH